MESFENSFETPKAGTLSCSIRLGTKKNIFFEKKRLSNIELLKKLSALCGIICKAYISSNS